jgi:hypothetical protein
MTPKDKAKELVDTYRIMLMNSDTECGNEILCTVIAKRCALIMCDELLCNSTFLISTGESYFWNEVKHEIEKL